MNRPAQKGIALIITLIMLSVVTFMAVAFLALSRRERSSVNVAAEQTTASLMADTALAHAQNLLVSRVLALTNRLAYEFMVSTNYINPRGFQTGNSDPTNVAYVYLNGAPVTGNDRMRLINNLLYSPRPPVYINHKTNIVQWEFPLRPNNLFKQPKSYANPWEFRYYVDLNRNTNFEPTGWLPTMVPDPSNPRVNPPVTNGQFGFYTGDPQWIGVLERPQNQHSGNNHFIGRYACMVLPEGKSLDLNFIHNQAKRLDPLIDGYNRNQGVGSWELNLAGLFRELNTNEWPPASYQFNTNLLSLSPSGGATFADALTALRYRYKNPNTNLSPTYNNLASVNYLTNLGFMGLNAGQEMRSRKIDYYTSGPRMANIYPLTNDVQDDTFKSWPGSDNLTSYMDLQDLFNAQVQNTDPNLPNLQARLKGWVNANTQASSYDRYTLYRLWSQLGVDSPSAAANKLNINYSNDASGIPVISSNYWHDWRTNAFFTNAAHRMLRSQFGYFNQNRFTVDSNIVINIPIYPTNHYSAAVHRVLQLAANIYDATTNRVDLTAGEPYLPHVYRPLFMKTITGNLTNVLIAGYQEEINANFLSFQWIRLNPAVIASWPINTLITNVLVQGIPVVIGAKKGLPNFNEYEMQTAMQFTRRLEFVRRNELKTWKIFQTNQLFELGISNRFALESWNSYASNYPRILQLMVTNQVHITLWTNNVIYTNFQTTLSQFTIIPATNWLSNEFRMPLLTTLNWRPFGAFPDASRPIFTPLVGLPSFLLTITNNLMYALVDRRTSPPRVIDFVNLNNLGCVLDITTMLTGLDADLTNDTAIGRYWVPNLVKGYVPIGVQRQIDVSFGNTDVSDAFWTSFVGGQDKGWSIDHLRVFGGFTPKFGGSVQEMQTRLGQSPVRQAPFTVTRKIFYTRSWQANDPLVHYTYEDLSNPLLTNGTVQWIVPPQNSPTNSNLGTTNLVYRPWGNWGNVLNSSDTNRFNMAVKDPGIRSSADWRFPTNKFPNLGWLGRVHRGTPWQTVYLKSLEIPTSDWSAWSGHTNMLSQPTNDWHLLELFTTAPNVNAARGLLSVNQTNTAAWAAVLGGVSVLRGRPTPEATNNFTEDIITPGTSEFRTLVDDINRARDRMPNKVFNYMGDVFASPALTTNSPYLTNYLAGQSDFYNLTDEVVERIPQQILSLVKEDEPRVVVYAFGQALTPSGPPIADPGASWHNMPTNYSVVSEVAWKQAFRMVVTSNQFTLTGSSNRLQIVPDGPRIMLTP